LKPIMPSPISNATPKTSHATAPTHPRSPAKSSPSAVDFDALLMGSLGGIDLDASELTGAEQEPAEGAEHETSTETTTSSTLPVAGEPARTEPAALPQGLNLSGDKKILDTTLGAPADGQNAVEGSPRTSAGDSPEAMLKALAAAGDKSLAMPAPQEGAGIPPPSQPTSNTTPRATDAALTVPNRFTGADPSPAALADSISNASLPAPERTSPSLANEPRAFALAQAKPRLAGPLDEKGPAASAAPTMSVDLLTSKSATDGTAIRLGITENTPVDSSQTAGAMTNSSSTQASTPFSTVSTERTSLNLVSREEIAINARLGTSAWAEEAGQKVMLLMHGGRQQAEIQVNPSELGPIEVRIDINAGEATVNFAVNRAETQTALENAMPRLRELFAERGLDLTNAFVGSERRSREEPRNPAERRSQAPKASLATQQVDSSPARRPLGTRGIDVFA
jgi:flagellar hook-length control protein FliK